MAARLQEKNKELGSQLLMAESTRLRLRTEDSELVYLEEHAIPGRAATIKVWSTTLPPEASPPTADARDERVRLQSDVARSGGET